MLSIYNVIEEFRVELENFLKTIKPSYLVIYEFDLPESEILKDNLIILSISGFNLRYSSNNILYEIQGVINFRFNISKTKDLFKDIINLIDGLVNNFKSKNLNYSSIEINTVDFNALGKEVNIGFQLKTINRR